MTTELVERDEAGLPTRAGSNRLLRIASRVGAWGLGLGIGITLLSPMLPGAIVTVPLSGAALVLGGLGAVVTSVLVLRRKETRLVWKIAGGLGIPFGTSYSILGLWWLLSMASWMAGDPLTTPALIKLAFASAGISGFVLMVIFGLDVARFVFKGLTREAEPSA